jgi:zona occludens toxin
VALTLVTGVPGSGKTLWAVWNLQRELKSGRRLLVNGIRDLALDHELVSDDDVRRWHEVVQPNDILVVDEVQRIWPPVPQGSKATVDIEKLHVHRHFGVDIVVITQHPNRMNKTVRDLVGRHVHVRRLLGLNRAMIYEWDSVHNPSAGFRDAVKSMWAYPKKAFALYTSAELHTKPKGVVPKALFFGPLALVAAVIFGWRAFHHLKPGAHESAAAKASAASAAVGASAPRGVPSRSWHIVGRFVIDGRAGIVVADSSGVLRAVEGKGFTGDGVWLEGAVDGERVGYWTGASGAAVAASPVPAMGLPK